MNSGIIRNALVCDGTGSKSRCRDLKFENGIITEIGKNLSGGLPEYPADGLLLTPGFIDIHAHSDLSLIAAPDACGKLSQGVTTEISGNCGLSPFPVLTEEVRDHLNSVYRKYGIPVSWNDFSGYVSAVEQRKPAVNFAAFCGYNTLRANFSGYEDSPLTESRIAEMKILLSAMLEQGAAGLSTGLLYVPGKFAPEREICSVASALKGTGKPISTHLRSEGDFLIESVQEAVRIAAAGDNRLQISHLKTALPGNWHKIDRLFQMIRTARKNGCRIHADRYPYVHAQTSLSVILPPPWESMSDAAILNDLRDDLEKQRKLLEKLKKDPPAWERIILCSTAYPEAADHAGSPYLEICTRLKTSPEELCVKLMAADAPGTMAAFGGLSEQNMMRILLDRDVCCGSDDTARPADFSLGKSHPRGFGSFPKFFRIVSETLGTEEAVRKMTSLPAEICNLKDRGILKRGCAADLVLLDPAKFRDRADFRSPHTLADGVEMVFVNGTLSFFDGKVVGHAGCALRIKNRR